MGKKLTTEDFIKKAKTVHGDKYDYSKVEYINSHTKVCIICPIHGEFYQQPNTHLNGCGCLECSKQVVTKAITSNNAAFIRKAQIIHGDKYNYSKVEYVNNRIKVCIICKEHGEFYQTPHNHLQGQGCPKCKGGIKFTKDEFITKATQTHHEKYDYSQITYVNAHSKIKIICPIHGLFEQVPYSHLQGQGCPDCGHIARIQSKSSTKEEFIKKAKEIHGNKYDYSQVKYINNYTKVCILCAEHGEFYQSPSDHLQGQGCPKCKHIKLEEELVLFFKEQGIEFEEQKRFEWLGRQSLDFYLPQYNVAIECQGIQHFKPIEYFGGINALLQSQIRDERKKKLCLEQNVKLLYYSNLNIKYPYKVYENKELLLEEIKKH